MAAVGTWALAEILSADADSADDERTATVVRVDADGTPWVHFEGGAEETPVRRKLAEVLVGDSVRVRVANGVASIVGSSSAPSISSARAAELMQPISEAARRASAAASVADAKAEEAILDADTAATAAAAAQGSADAAATAASAAQDSADQAISDAAAAATAATAAQGSADTAIADAAAAKSAADSAQADATAAGAAAASAQADATAAGSAAASAQRDAMAAGTAAANAQRDATQALADAATAAGAAAAAQASADNAASAASAAQTSATQANTAASNALTQLSTVQDVVGIVEWAATHSEQDMADYINSHLSLTTYGLDLVLDNTGYRIHIGTLTAGGEDGVYIIDGSGDVVTTFGENIDFSSSRPQYIGGEDAYIVFVDTDSDGIPDTIRIGGNIIMGGNKTLSEILSDVAGAKQMAEDVPIVTLSSTNGTVFKRNLGIDTTIVATIFTPGGRIDNATELHRRFGAGAYLQWGWRDVVTDADHVLPSTDPRIGNGGFTLTVSPEDIDVQAVITCSLNY